MYKWRIASHRIYSIKRRTFFFLAYSRAAFIRGRCLLRNYISYITANNKPFAMASFYYCDQNLSGYCFRVQIKAFVIQTSLGLPNLNRKEKNEMNSGLSSKRRHRANGPLR